MNHPFLAGLLVGSIGIVVLLELYRLLTDESPDIDVYNDAEVVQHLRKESKRMTDLADMTERMMLGDDPDEIVAELPDSLKGDFEKWDKGDQ